VTGPTHAKAHVRAHVPLLAPPTRQAVTVITAATISRMTVGSQASADPDRRPGRMRTRRCRIFRLFTRGHVILRRQPGERGQHRGQLRV
jgi:hypothetical protein